LKPARKPEQTIKATFLDRNENEVKELVYTFDDSDPKDNIILIVSQLAKRYNQWQENKWKILEHSQDKQPRPGSTK
jgi:hypothetical protein